MGREEKKKQILSGDCWCHQQRTPTLLPAHQCNPGLPFPAHTHSHGSRCMMLSFLLILKPTIISDDIKTQGLGGLQPTQQKKGCPNAVCLQIFHTLDYYSCLQHSLSLVSLRLCLFLSPNYTLICISTVATLLLTNNIRGTEEQESKLSTH